MNKTTPTLTQSGLLAVLLECQHRKAVRLARRRARWQRLRSAVLDPFNPPSRALQEPRLPGMISYSLKPS